MDLKPPRGGSLRPFGAAWFIIAFLKGNAPENSKRANPAIGCPMTDVCHEYRSALHRAYSRDAVEREEEKRIRKGGLAYTEEQYTKRLEYYLSRMPYKLSRMKYSSFTRYCGHLKRLGWIEESGKIEPSTIQEDYPAAPSRVYYRLTKAGRQASPADLADPIMTLYHYTRAQRSAKNNLYIRA